MPRSARQLGTRLRFDVSLPGLWSRKNSVSTKQRWGSEVGMSAAQKRSLGEVGKILGAPGSYPELATPVSARRARANAWTPASPSSACAEAWIFGLGLRAFMLVIWCAASDQSVSPGSECVSHAMISSSRHQRVHHGLRLNFPDCLLPSFVSGVQMPELVGAIIFISSPRNSQPKDLSNQVVKCMNRRRMGQQAPEARVSRLSWLNQSRLLAAWIAHLHDLRPCDIKQRNPS